MRREAFWNSSPRSRASCLAGLVLLAMVGCGGGASGDNLPRQGVSGTITLDGMPVDHGFIQFRPVGSAGASGTVVAGEIKAGKYAIPRDQGPVPGGYRISISSTEDAPASSGSDMPGQVSAGAKELIPSKYNSASNLDREVKGGGDNTIDFELKR